MREPNKRPRRNPLTSEEVSHIIAHKKKKELVTLERLKKTRYFKVYNIFNILCIFIYLEVLLCYFGPCHYQQHYSTSVVPHYGSGKSVNGKLFISDIDVSEGRMVYKFIIEDVIEVPAKTVRFVIGKDFLLQKELKGVFESSENAYRLFSASPVLLLCAMVCSISFFGFIMNLNQNAYALGSLSTLNFLTLFAILMLG